MGGPMQCGSGAVHQAPTGATGKDPRSVATALKQLLARTEIIESRALVAVSDAVATFRILRLPKTATDQDVTALVSKELPLDPEKLATRWFDLSPRDDERVVYAAAWDRDLVKEAADAVRMAGLEPVVVELKSVCVARVTPVGSCIVIDLTSEPVEIFLTHRYAPQVWHSVPAGAPVADNLARAVAAPVRSVLRFYRRQNGQDLPASSPILLSGEQALPVSALDELAALVDHPVQLLPPPPRIPSGVRHAAYLTCLGLLMRRGG